ncbi:glycoside hydrolase family 3 C-terminal domain-containing protein [Streptomyces sp. B21-088]|uniref:glycoside hydrolase family 3 C-terminal domain-containing protein n=1 Tax=unclassified Streptomyces TaxID=2593676 RepID=UPI002274C982|nr:MULTISPECIES: glycoside hydrolase family 3 C-terminal domain-containing protein [unclassified Streptomyces]MCY1654805.1 glycoside hydrolase family 3 C-terminal domain-containing protein [Streptomyces sp. SL203]MCY1677874.1 glycoside hydrolase family 3 C-terminal domain-containing protein [Streptomyces sp. SL294]
MTDHPLPFRDPQLSFSRRTDDLLGRLTLDERIAMLHQFAPAVERLGLGPFRTGQEALHGVAWMGPATVFPQAVGLGATWNDELVRRVGEAVGNEVRAKRAQDDRVGLNVWAPTVNLLRHPLWGRGEEGYSEDPALTSAIAVAYTRGLRGDHPHYWRTAPVLKHWLAHNNETERDTASSSVRPRVLHEYDLRAFRDAVRAGAVAGVMPAYNLVNGRPNHVSPLLEQHLRSWTDQPLVVCSDAGAPSNLVDSEHYFDTHEEATAAALKAGVDSFTDHGTDSTVMTGRIRDALAKGLLDESDIDTAVRRLLAMRFALGEFDPELDPYAQVDALDTAEHRALALEAAEQAVVLLKNDGLLPLAPGQGRTVAVVGLLADDCKLDWYSGTLMHRSTPLDGIRERYGAENVLHTEGVDRIRLKTSDGWLRVPEADGTQDGEARGAEGALDPALLAGRTDLPPLTCGDEATELALVDWGDGVLTLRTDEGLYLSVADDGYVRASADEPGGWVVQETFRREEVEGHDGGHRLLHIGTGGYVSVAADGAKVAVSGEKISREDATVFESETVESGADAVARIAAAADTVIVVAGNDPHINGRETEDRTTLALPAQQDRLWRAAHAANPRTVLVLSSAYPYAVVDAAAALPALLWTAHGGQAAGTALARVLAGDVSPAGRLPQTWYASDDDLPGLFDYDVIGSRQTYLYFRGTPLFPFGHGLGYADFTYSGLRAEADGDQLRVSLTVTNDGTTAADEVAQVYVRAAGPAEAPAPEGLGRRLPGLGDPSDLPLRKLAGHRRLHLAPGAARSIEFTVPLEELGHWNVAHGRWAVEPGGYEILAGASSADIRLTTTTEVGGEALGPRPVKERGIEAADYDRQQGTELVDRAKTEGDAVAPASADDEGRLVYRACDFGDGVRALAFQVSGEGRVTVSAAGHNSLIQFPDTGGPYSYRTVEVAVDLRGVQELRIGLTGSVRLARIDVVPGKESA